MDWVAIHELQSSSGGNCNDDKKGRSCETLSQTKQRTMNLLSDLVVQDTKQRIGSAQIERENTGNLSKDAGMITWIIPRRARGDGRNGR